MGIGERKENSSHLRFPVGLESQQTSHLAVHPCMENGSAHDIARVGINALQDLEAVPRHDLPLLRQVDVPSRIQRDREDALRLARRAPDELPSLEEVRRAELDALEELRDHNGKADGDGLVRAGEEGDDEDGGRLEDLLALDLDDLLDLCAGRERARRDLHEGGRDRLWLFVVQRRREGCEGRGYLVSDVDRDLPKRALVARFDADLNLDIFVEDTLGSIHQLIEPPVNVRSDCEMRDALGGERR